MYRCGVIHEYRVDVEEDEFFTKTGICWRTVYYPWDTNSPRLEIHFPAATLLRLLESCISNYVKELQHTRRLPAPIFFEICDPESELEFLDEESIPTGKDLRPH